MQMIPRHDKKNRRKIDLNRPVAVKSEVEGACRSVTSNLASPHRRCLACGVSFPKADLLRFVSGPDLQVMVDFQARLPGKGFYLHPGSACLKLAIRKKLFQRAASRISGQTVSIAPDFAEKIYMQAKKHALQRIGLAKRAGFLVSGLEKVKAAIKKGNAGLYLCANDSNNSECDKLQAIFGRPNRSFRLFTANEQGEALGRGQLVHIALDKRQQHEALVKMLFLVQQLSGNSSDDEQEVQIQNSAQ